MRNLAIFAAITGLSFMGALSAQNIVADGSFETPATGPGGCDTGITAFTVGQTFGPGWTVVGSSSGNVDIFPNTETIGPLGNCLVTATVQQGTQAIDLTGFTDNGAATGVEQVLTTTPGTQYLLTFWVGDVNSASYSASGTASIVAKINGTPVLTANNSGASGVTFNWQQFSVNFTATGTSTTLDFINNTASGVGAAGLDNVSVTAVSSGASPSVTPVPPSVILSIIGIAFVGLYAAWRSCRTGAIS